MTPLAHGGTLGLAVELGAAAALGAVLLWALWRGRSGGDDGNDEGRP